MNWHRLSSEEIFEFLDTRPHGLSAADAEAKQMQYGPNELQEGKKKSITGMFLVQFKVVMILILLAAAIISVILGDLTDTVVILIIVLLNAIIGFLPGIPGRKSHAGFKTNGCYTSWEVLRDGNTVWLPANLLVPGDVVLLEAGNAVPADIRISESINLKIEDHSFPGSR